ncbi:hypothetical protein K501DRAFT_275855 [Backusella circina FSU 941]|nr:hypothetical protein K501DRAFT_275855 [Backusella circina FSU 941]
MWYKLEKNHFALALLDARSETSCGPFLNHIAFDTTTNIPTSLLVTIFTPRRAMLIKLLRDTSEMKDEKPVKIYRDEISYTSFQMKNLSGSSNGKKKKQSYNIFMGTKRKFVGAKFKPRKEEIVGVGVVPNSYPYEVAESYPTRASTLSFVVTLGDQIETSPNLGFARQVTAAYTLVETLLVLDVGQIDMVTCFCTH